MLLILLALLLVAGLSQWVRNLNGDGKPARSLSHQPDYTMDDFTITAMGPTGKPKHQLQARYMAHYPDDGSTEFTQPHLTVYRDKGAPWHLYSERGWMSAERKFVLFRGDVLMENPQAPPSRIVRMVTKDLRVVVDEEFAETDQAVTIRSKTSVTHGVGMHAYLKEGRLQLLSKVRGTYEPRVKPKTKKR
ncbi:MAG TPA: LPS export ABC transporter periplasmic protein LptC [Gammaproteobacteria bacterium]|nr:LPS export ABC transporter periplasmic protein LptC [Gammaproteobacteria bacterium]